MKVQDPKVANQGLNLHGSISEGKSFNSDQKKELKGDLMIQRTLRTHAIILTSLVNNYAAP
jgi:hypothetical protein